MRLGGRAADRHCGRTRVEPHINGNDEVVAGGEAVRGVHDAWRALMLARGAVFFAGPARRLAIQLTSAF